MNKRIKVDFFSHSSIGMNQSGMKTQIDTLFEFFKEDDLLEVKKYDIWSYRNPDIIHVFGMGQGIYNHLKLFSKKGVKIICSPNHWPSRSIIEKILMRINFKDVVYTNRQTKKYLIDNADLFVVNSNAEEKMFIDFFNIDSERIEVIYNSYGEDPVTIKEPIFRIKYQVEGPFALMVGQIGSVRKNQFSVIKNWKKNYPNLLILGGFDKTPYGIACMDEINDKKNVKYLGFESDPLILESAYQHCDLFISPGLIETPGLSAFRALTNGAKICSTNSGGAPQEYFGENVKYFNPLNVNEIINCIENAFNSEKWNINISELKNFSTENICNQYKRAYQNILK